MDRSEWVMVRRETLQDVLDYVGEDCRVDHHGLCQEHGLQEADECFGKVLREVLAEQASGEAWTCELIFAGYQPNGYKLLRNGKMVARIDTHDEADDEQLAHRIVAALKEPRP